MKKKKYCENCGSRENLVIGHRDGNESNGAPYNLGTFCKSCNGIQSVADKRAGRGVRTRQYNPKKRKNPGSRSLGEYVSAAVSHSRGSHDEGGRIIHETPKAKRREFAREIWFRRGYRNPASQVMTEWRTGKLRTSAGDLVPRGKAGERQARAILLSELRREGKIGPRENPDGSADALYREFHGVEPDSHIVFDASLIDPYGSHPEIAQFGLLVRMIVGEGIEVKASANTEDVDVTAVEDYAWNAEIAFVPSIREYKKDARTLRTQQDIDQFKSWLRKNGTPDVAGSPDAKQIYIIGGNLDVVEDRLAYMGADTSKEVVDLGFLYLLEYFTQKNFDGMDPVDYFHHMGEKTKVRPRVIFWRKPQVLQIVGGEYRITARGIEN